jgi:MtrB/PioB family decaheme-associated outer membrane protein
MKIRAELLVTCAALVIGTGTTLPAMAADMFTKAPAMPAAEPLPWWYEGFAEIGGRVDLNSPDKKDLGKFYEYRDLRPGVFGNFFIGAHRTNDPLDFEVWGKNIGWNDQAFGFDLTKPGQHYLTLGWDETPHVYSKNAKTLYDGVGTNNLTIPYDVRNYLNGVGPSQAAADYIAAHSKTIDVKIRRDTFSAGYRWTPTDNWDVSVDYSHMHRDGTQPLSAVSFASTSTNGTRSTYEMPRPVDDVTQNGNIKAEYSGSTPWGKQFNVALGGGFSDYSNSVGSLSFQNPWNDVETANWPVNNLYSLEPNNKAQTINLSGGVGLPLNSRYMGTFQYTNMQVDDANLPWTNNSAYGTVPVVITPNRDAATTLFNNVLYTKFAPNLKSTLRYRYYNFDSKNDSPVEVLPDWWANPDSHGGNCVSEGGVCVGEERFPRNFTKQNADAQLVWQAVKWLSVGGSYDWERWDRGQWRDAPVTNENSGKIFADAKWSWSTLRASLLYGERRYDSWSTEPIAGGVDPAFRMRDLANRNRTKFQASWAVQLTNMLSVTPNGGLLYDDYQTNFEFSTPGASEAGVNQVHLWNAGVDVTLNVNHNVAFFVSYNRENQNRNIYQRNSTPDLNIDTTDRTNTVIFGSKLTLIPEKLYLDANYTYSKSTSEWNLACTPLGCRYTPLAVYPDIHNTMERLDVQAKYLFDDSFMRHAGFAGKAYVKARVLWEKNSNDSWQSLQDQLGWLVNPNNSTTAASVWMGMGNPNYDVVLGTLTFGVKW